MMPSIFIEPSQNIQHTFTTPLLAWYDLHGRKDLPWQTPYDAYRVWLSEIMLQQTQVKTVIGYFIRFITQFSDVRALASATEDEVLALWSGLGYYSRARNLHKTAKIIVNDFQCQFPHDSKILETLPGIGPSTAAAISSLAFEKPCAILDGNVIRVLSRYFLIEGVPDIAPTKKLFRHYADACVSNTRARAYSQAIMDLGATLCMPKNPQCVACPLKQTCAAHSSNQVSLFPQKSLKKIRPIKHEKFLLLQTNQGKIYLEKRPPKGIWGGLWCLPTLEQSACVKTYLTNTFEFNPAIIYSFMQFKHIFTHFQLNIEALLIPIDDEHALKNIHLKKGEWFEPHNLHHIGLAKPITTLVEHLILKGET